MSDKEFKAFLAKRKTDCPVCDLPMSQHDSWEKGKCITRDLEIIFDDANGGELA
jgi:hypothetical protein